MRLFVVMFAVVLGTSCALRPRYRDFVTAKTETKQVVLLVSNSAGAPMADVKIEMSEWKNRVAVTSGTDGTFTLPVDKKYLDENPVLVVQVPPGQWNYRLALAPPPLPAPEPLPAVEPVVDPPPVAPTPVAPPAPQGTSP